MDFMIQMDIVNNVIKHAKNVQDQPILNARNVMKKLKIQIMETI